MPAFGARGLPAFKRRIREAVAVDETKLKAIGCQIYAVVVRDPPQRGVSSVYASHARPILSASLYLVASRIDAAATMGPCG